MATASVLPDDTIPAISDMAEPRAATAHEQVGPYELLSELAQGGMGRVYLARERGEGGYNRLVALKRIHDHLASQKAFVDMFLDEARIASQIQHPHVCTVFDFGRADDSYFISMEYLRGVPLSDVLRQLGTRSPDASPRRYAFAAHLLAQACEGLHAAHELRDAAGDLLQVVHRDVSPHNLFVSFDGTLRVLDFGIARAINRIAESTTGRVKGKFAYMAPEQALGRQTDRRSDVFSVGVVLWEFCTLQRLFKRDSPAETILQVVHEATPSPSDYVDLPPELERICMRALSKDPADRFKSARQMGRALSRAAAALGPPITAGDVEEWVGRLFPGASDRSLSALEPHTAGISIGPVEVTGLRAKTPPAAPARPRPGSRRRGVPALVAVISAVLAAAIAFVVARITQPGPAPQRLPSTLPALPAPSEPSAPGGLDRPADLVFDAPEAEPPDEPDAPEPDLVPEPAAPPRETPRRRRERASPSSRPSSRRGRRREPVAAASAATGRVRVGGPPSMWDAPIVFHGRRLGVIPDTIELPVGAQTIEIRVPGRDPVRRRVQVQVGQVTRVTIR